MPSFECHCGARYKFPESATGRRARCKSCGTVITLEPGGVGIIPLAPEDPELAGPKTVARAAPLPTAAVEGAAPVGTDPIGGGHSAPLIPAADPSTGYGDSLLWTILFPASPSNLVTFLVIWAGLTVAGYVQALALLFGVIISLLVTMWYAAFQFELVQSAAGGDENIPNLGLDADSVVDYLGALLCWVGSWVLVLAPAFAYAAAGLGLGATSVRDALTVLSTGLPGIVLALGSDPVLVVLIVVGLLLWPMVILWIALGGFSAGFRLDQMLSTMARAPGPYLITVGLVLGATIGEYVIRELLATRMAPAPGAGAGGALTTAMLSALLLNGARLYLDIVALRSIGLYYHHFKHKFGTGWG